MKIAAWAAMAGLVFLAPGARATEPVASGRAEAADVAPTAQTNSAPAPVAQGMRAALDPDSRELTEPQLAPESAREAAEGVTDALAPMDFSKVRIEHLPDGSVHIDLNGQVRMAAFGRIDAEGHATTWCAPGTPGELAQPAAKAATGLESTP